MSASPPRCACWSREQSSAPRARPSGSSTGGRKVECRMEYERIAAMSVDTAMPAAELQSAGLDRQAGAEWTAGAPQRTGDYYVDRPRYSRYWQLGADLF